MRQTAFVATAIMLSLCACSRPPPQEHATETGPADKPQPEKPKQSVSPSINGGQPPNHASLAEPSGPIDPKSVEAAGQVVQSYGALIEQGQWKQANALWGDAATAGQFQATFGKSKEVHLEIGNLGDPEGAAGSIYVTMPVIFYGDDSDGQPFRRSADVILRRVNDVPGSSEAQRRWHIERIDWAGAP